VREVGLLILVALSGAVLTPSAVAGLPGYVEWVIWEEAETVGVGASPTRAFRWVVGPYPRRTDCERDRQRVEAHASQRDASVVTRLLCVPDTVDPREDSRWHWTGPSPPNAEEEAAR
jgi:hypothetical protein